MYDSIIIIKKNMSVLLLLENGPGAGEAEDGASDHVYPAVV